MIGRLQGNILEIDDGQALIDVMGVGYIVGCATCTLGRLQPGERATLHIEMVTREDGSRLYGFLDKSEHKTFSTLINVQGVGPKAALAILDVLSPQELLKAIAFEDKTAICRANGVGPKLAARLITELKDKPIAGADLSVTSFAPSAPPANTHVSEALAALMSLGLSDVAARRGVDAALKEHGDDADVQVLIKSALKGSNA